MAISFNPSAREAEGSGAQGKKSVTSSGLPPTHWINHGARLNSIDQIRKGKKTRGMRFL